MKIVGSWECCCLLQLLLFSGLWGSTSSLGSMSSIAISYGEKGSVFCGLKSDGSHSVTCYGSNSAIISGTPAHLQFIGLTAGDGFVCGLLMESQQPYCWGNSGQIHMGVPQPMIKGAEYSEISAGDYHLCALRKHSEGARQETNLSLVDCWGYKMTRNYVFDGQMHSISAGSVFNCGLSSREKTVFCWGDEATSRITSLIPRRMKFEKIAAGSYHVCGIQEGLNSRVFCWGKSLGFSQEDMTQTQISDVDLPPKEPLASVVGGKFHACGIKSNDLGVICWGFIVNSSTAVPKGIKFSALAAGNYFTCGVPAEISSLPVCWGVGFPKSLPLPEPVRICRSTPCAPGTYEQSRFENSPCKSPGTHLCLPCSTSCPPEMYRKRECTSISDQICEYNCSSCFSPECSSNCSSSFSNGRKNDRFLKLPFIIAELSFALFVITVASMVAVLYVRCRLRNCHCSAKDSKSRKDSALAKTHGKIGPELEKLKLRRARTFTYKELAIATCMFEEESLIGKGSFSCVYKGVLKNGINVAVKKATMSSDQQKNLKEFHTEVDLLSRLNHAHLLNLLGYCEEGGERLLVYEFMAHGSLYNHLHGKDMALKEQMSWVRRVTIAVQASRGIEYLHGYACPPVIHRDIKSSNILIDEEFNARVADFGLSLLGPVDSSSPLAELPAGTLGYLDPEYYRLHYLTTKSDVYSFGVLLLELLSGRKAIDLQYEQGNIVEWAVPLIKSGDLSSILDPVLNPDLNPPTISEALKRIANVACKCVRMRGRDRPSMDKVTTALERSLAQLMGSPSLDQPILPSEVVLGSRRMHKKKSSTTSSNQSFSEAYDQGTEFRAPSWITFPSVASSQRRKSSVSEGDVVGLGEGRNQELKNDNGVRCDFVLRKLEEEIGPASPQQDLFLQHNF